MEIRKNVKFRWYKIFQHKSRIWAWIFNFSIENFGSHLHLKLMTKFSNLRKSVYGVFWTRSFKQLWAGCSGDWLSPVSSGVQVSHSFLNLFKAQKYRNRIISNNLKISQIRLIYKMLRQRQNLSYYTMRVLRFLTENYPNLRISTWKNFLQRAEKYF